MLRASNSLTGDSVTSIDPQWLDNVDQLRKSCHDGVILCPECKQPVTLHAGAVRVWHFAHRTHSNCPLGRESAEVLKAKAMLYKLLQGVFGDMVTLEEEIPGGTPVDRADCVVSLPEHKIAYFIVEKQIRDRSDFIHLRRKAYSRIHWILLPRLIQRVPDSKNNVILSATVRDLASLEGVEHMYRYPGSSKCGSLYCAYIKEDLFAIARGLGLVHSPNVFKPEETFRLRINQIRVDHETGQLMALEEVPRMNEWRKQQEVEKAKQKEAEAIALKRRLEDEQKLRKRMDSMRQALKETSHRSRVTGSKPQQIETKAKERILTCLRCGNNVKKWVYEQHDGCVCWKCEHIQKDILQIKIPTKPKVSAEDVDEQCHRKELPCLHCGKRTRNWIKFGYPNDYRRGVCLCVDCDAKGYEFPYDS